MLPLVEEAEQSLSKEQKSQLYASLLDYHILFATGEQDIGQTSNVQHRIDTGMATNSAVRSSNASFTTSRGKESSE